MEETRSDMAAILGKWVGLRSVRGMAVEFAVEFSFGEEGQLQGQLHERGSRKVWTVEGEFALPRVTFRKIENETFWQNFFGATGLDAAQFEGWLETETDSLSGNWSGPSNMSGTWQAERVKGSTISLQGSLQAGPQGSPPLASKLTSSRMRALGGARQAERSVKETWLKQTLNSISAQEEEQTFTEPTIEPGNNDREETSLMLPILSSSMPIADFNQRSDGTVVKPPKIGEIDLARNSFGQIVPQRLPMEAFGKPGAGALAAQSVQPPQANLGLSIVKALAQSKDTRIEESSAELEPMVNAPVPENLANKNLEKQNQFSDLQAIETCLRCGNPKGDFSFCIQCGHAYDLNNAQG